ncbi:MAG: VWA domain-containing protein [Lacipirellulaceae bacterium]
MADPTDHEPSEAERLRRARRELLEREAAWRIKRAEVARLVAAGDDAAANAILRELGEGQHAGARSPEKAATEAKDAAAQRRAEQRRAEQRRAVTRPAGVAPPTGSIAPRRPRRSRAQPPASAKPSEASSRPGQGSSAQPPSSASRAALKRSRSTRPRGFVATVVAWRARLARQPPWVVSLTTHAALLGVLALVSFGSILEMPLTLTASLAPLSEDYLADAPMSDAAIDLAAAEIAAADSPALELAAFVPDASVEPASAAELAATPIDFGTTLAGDAESLMASVGEKGSGSAKTGGGEGPAGQPRGMGERVRFFGSETQASRVAFVVDNSGSMQRGRMETTLFELARAVQGLSQSQSFYVVLFSDQPYAMMFPEADPGPLEANPENKRRLVKWLDSVQMCLGGRLTEAVELASHAKPQVLYLLTDGDIRSPRVMADLTRKGAWKFTIHTLGMGVRTPDDAAKLEAIAAATGGSFRMVQAHPDAVRRSFARPLPYNRTPGPVWGSAVQAWTP